MGGELLEAMTTDGSFNKAQYQTVVLAFYRAIAESYAQDKSRPTQRETTRRFAILETTFRMLRHDYNWGVERIVAALPRALRAKLDGMSFKPEMESRIWTPDGS